MKLSVRILQVLSVSTLLMMSVGGAVASDQEDFRFDTTDDLYQVCTTPASAEEYIPSMLACRAFIEATVQYHDQVAGHKKAKKLICYQETTTIEDARNAFVTWGEKNVSQKKLAKEAPVVGLVRSLAVAYPCR